MKFWIMTLVLIGTAGLAITTPLGAVEGKKPPKEEPAAEIDEAGIYIGDPSDYRLPAVVNTDEVYAKIPEYREILERNIDDSNPRYLFLMRRASDRFRTALDTVARSKGYDLIGVIGSIKIPGKNVPDITALVISSLPK